MKPYSFFVPTSIYTGKNTVRDHADLITSLGRKAFVITSRFEGNAENLALREIKEILDTANIKYEVFEDVPSNPPTEDCVAVFRIAQKFDPDFIIAIGGGSPIDCSKAVNLLLQYPDRDPDELFFSAKGSLYDQTGSEGKLPIIAIPTTAGTGAEVSGAAVLTRIAAKTKEPVKHKMYCKYAFLDARYIRESPAYLIHTGVLDALAHSVETYVNVRSNILNRGIAEIYFKMFASFKDNMLRDTLTDEDFEMMLCGANISGIAFMQSGTTIPHGMGYPLSQFKHVNHGLSCSITLGEYLRVFKNQATVAPIVKACGFNTVEEMCDFFAEIIRRDLHIKVTEAEIDEWTDRFMNQKDRLARNPEPLTRNDIHQIYMNSLKDYIVRA